MSKLVPILEVLLTLFEDTVDPVPGLLDLVLDLTVPGLILASFWVNLYLRSENSWSLPLRPESAKPPRMRFYWSR